MVKFTRDQCNAGVYAISHMSITRGAINSKVTVMTEVGLWCHLDLLSSVYSNVSTLVRQVCPCSVFACNDASICKLVSCVSYMYTLVDGCVRERLVAGTLRLTDTAVPIFNASCSRAVVQDSRGLGVRNILIKVALGF